MLNSRTFHPDFKSECRICDAKPTVIVYDAEARTNSATELCGIHFFNDRAMFDHEEWNEPREATE